MPFVSAQNTHRTVRLGVGLVLMLAAPLAQATTATTTHTYTDATFVHSECGFTLTAGDEISVAFTWQAGTPGRADWDATENMADIFAGIGSWWDATYVLSVNGQPEVQGNAVFGAADQPTAVSVVANAPDPAISSFEPSTCIGNNNPTSLLMVNSEIPVLDGLTTAPSALDDPNAFVMFLSYTDSVLWTSTGFTTTDGAPTVTAGVETTDAASNPILASSYSAMFMETVTVGVDATDDNTPASDIQVHWDCEDPSGNGYNGADPFATSMTLAPLADAGVYTCVVDVTDDPSATWSATLGWSSGNTTQSTVTIGAATNLAPTVTMSVAAPGAIMGYDETTIVFIDAIDPEGIDSPTVTLDVVSAVGFAQFGDPVVNGDELGPLTCSYKPGKTTCWAYFTPTAHDLGDWVFGATATDPYDADADASATTDLKVRLVAFKLEEVSAGTLNAMSAFSCVLERCGSHTIGEIGCDSQIDQEVTQLNACSPQFLAASEQVLARLKENAACEGNCDNGISSQIDDLIRRTDGIDADKPGKDMDWVDSAIAPDTLHDLELAQDALLAE